jgi:transposase
MAETLTSGSARGDDLPLVRAQLDRRGVHPLLDAHVPTHGNWVGLSLGWVTVLWLTPLLSEADHRRHQGHPWAQQRLHPLGSATGHPVPPLDLSDDRLAAVRATLRAEARGPAFAGAVTHHVLRVYDLPAERGRLETTTASGDWRVSADGLCQFGHRQDHRPALAQGNVRRSGLAPLGLPGATDVVPGQRAEAPLSRPAIARVRARLGQRGLLEGGDCQRGAREPRASIHAAGDCALGPLSALQGPPARGAASLAPVWTGAQPLPPRLRPQGQGGPTVSAEGFEGLESRPAGVAGKPRHGTERRVVRRSPQLVQAGERGLRARLAQAPAAIVARNTGRRGNRQRPEWPTLQAAVAASVARDHGQGGRPVRYAAQARWQAVRRDRDRPARRCLQRDWQVPASVDAAAVAAAVRPLGWRVDAPTAPPEPLALTQAVLADRRQSLVESDLGRLNGQPWSLPPMSRQRDEHATGLIRLLSIGWRGLTWVELVVRPRVATTGPVLAGVYTENPKRATARPTPERLRTGVAGLPLTIIREGRRRAVSPHAPLGRAPAPAQALALPGGQLSQTVS